MQQGPIGPQPQHEPQGAEGATPKAAPATEGATPKAALAAGSTASQAVYVAAAADDEPRGGDQAEPAGEPGLPDDGQTKYPADHLHSRFWHCLSCEAELRKVEMRLAHLQA